jgi:3-hydroxyisobutyrate dehydrogenase-like beta-hydroxyacid dehydrogenase
MDTLLTALRSGAAGSWALTHRADGMVEGHYPLGFKLALHRKDLAIAQQAAAAVDLPLPISDRVAAMEDDLIHGGHGEQDVSVLAEWFRA